MNTSTLRRQVRNKTVRSLPVTLIAAAVITFIILILPAGVFSGEGTWEHPYIVSTAADLKAVSKYLDACYVQTKDIDISSYPNWDPIGADYKSFRGTYDGNGYKIVGLSIAGDMYTLKGLFGIIGTGGTVKNLGVSGKAFHEFAMLGLLAGFVNSGTVENCWSTGEVQSNSYQLGGLVGMVSNGGIIRRCYSTAAVIGGRDKSGSVGGLCGSLINGSVMENSYAAGPVSGGDAVGGLVGTAFGIEGQNTVIRDCYALGAVTGRTNLGGLIGYVTAGNITIKDCFWDKETSGLQDSAGGTAKTTSEMKDKATFIGAGWDVAGEHENGTDDIWKLDVKKNGGYPGLYWQ